MMYTEYAGGGNRPLLAEKGDFNVSDKAKASRAEYMRQYRKTERGAERSRAATKAYWERRAERERQQDTGKGKCQAPQS